MSKQPRLFTKYADDYHRLFLVDVDGELWASNSYWAVPVRSTDHPIAKLLALYNLPLAPGIIDVGETLVPIIDSAATFRQEKFVAVVRSAPGDLEPLTRHSLNGSPLYGYDGTNRLAIFELPGGRYIAVNDRYRAIVEERSVGEWYGGPDPLKPIYRRHEGKTVGLLMGVRCGISEHQPASEVDVIVGAGA